MEEVDLSFGMTAVIVVDTDIKFISVFKDMCTELKISLWPLAGDNHKELSFEKITYFSTKHKQSWVRIEELIDISYKIPRLPNMLGISH